jgi:DNA excision repair protein ERCC-6-like 2
LGKTIQTIAFLSAVIGKGNDHGEQSTDQRKKSDPVLILCPTSVIRNWENEFVEWAEFSVAVYHGPNRDLVLERIETQGLEVLITSFDTFRIHDKILCAISWELVVADEAHRLKNEKSKLYEACLGITTQKRFGLTGTIMQNKIMELFNLFDWFVPGCLGDREHFRAYYDEPLKHGQRVSAPERFIQVADTRKKHLVSVLKKFLLRRTKEETIGHLMLGKEDNIIFCRMSDVQKRVYTRMLQQPDIQILINKDLPCSCGSHLTQVECCKIREPHGIIWSYLHKDNPEGCPICPFCLVLPCLVKLQQVISHSY